MTNKIFENKKVDLKKLKDYGFVLMDDKYVYIRDICSLGLRLTVIYCDEITVEVTDVFSNEEYVLYKIPSAVGEFVGCVRSEIEKTLSDVCEKCFEGDVFKIPITKMIISHVREKYGDELEFLWKTDPDCAILRRKDTGKWYGVIMKVSRSKFGIPSDDTIEIMNLHAKAEDVINLVDNKSIFPAFHMNKKYWISLILEEFKSIDDIVKLIEDSYTLARK